MNTVLDVIKLCKNYKDFQIKDVTFSIKAGSITGFIGINGAGKTTTIKSIAGLIRPDSGDILLFGKDKKKNEKELLSRIGIVLDGDYFYDNLTLKEMKNIYSRAYKNWDEICFNELIIKFDLPLNKKVESLSKGMKMKYALALAMSHNAELLIMDEPTSGLDPKVRSDLMNILSDFIKDGKKSVLLSSHITSDLEKVADSLILINKGEIIFHDKTDHLIQEHIKLKGDYSYILECQLKKFVSYCVNEKEFIGIIKKNICTKEEFSMFQEMEISIEDLMLAYIEGGYHG